MSATPLPVNLVYCYDANQIDLDLLRELKMHMTSLRRSGRLVEQELSAGAGEADAKAQVDQADIVLLIVTPNLMFSAEDNAVFLHAQARHQAGQLRVIPILVRAYDWTKSPFSGLVALPRNGQPVFTQRDRDTAWMEVVKGITTVVDELWKSSTTALTGNKGPQSPMQKAPPLVQATFHNGHALLVGVGEDLPITINDATALHDLLSDPARAAYPASQVELLTGPAADRQGVLAALTRLADRTKDNPEATIIVYYSGHGYKVSSAGAAPTYHLLTHGYDISDAQRLAETTVSGSEFSAKIDALQGRKVLVLLDCCHAAGLSQAKAPPGVKAVSAPLPQELLSSLNQGSGRLIMTSSKEDQLSYILPTDRNSLFTRCLLEALQGEGAAVGAIFAEALSVLQYVIAAVPKHVNNVQQPVLTQVANMTRFSICYIGGGQGKAPPPPPRALTAQQRMQQAQRDALAKRFDKHLGLWTRLNARRAVSIDIPEQDKLDYDIEQQAEEMRKVQQQLDDLG